MEDAKTPSERDDSPVSVTTTKPQSLISSLLQALNEQGDPDSGICEQEESKKKSSKSEKVSKDGPAQLLYKTISAAGSEDSELMTVKFSRSPKCDKTAKCIYPYRDLPATAKTYRGFPTDGSKRLLESDRWMVQIVAPGVGSPSEALPQFPQQEILVRSADAYVGSPAIPLSEKQVMFNSGEAYLDPNQKPPTSDFFYTAGYHKGSAVRLQKPFPQSIYRSVVANTPLPVKVVEGAKSAGDGMMTPDNRSQMPGDVVTPSTVAV